MRQRLDAVAPSGPQNSPLAVRRSFRKFFMSIQASRQARSPETLSSKPVSSRQRGTLSQTSRSPLQEKKLSTFYPFITGFPFPLGPLFSRQTIRRQVEKDIWCFEQTQALESFSVFTPVRMTVIRLKNGGLWVHSPVAPTEECIALLNELGGPVEYIVLPTFAYEHKVSST